MNESGLKQKIKSTHQLSPKEQEEIQHKIQRDMCHLYHYLVRFGVISNAAAGLGYVFANYHPTNASLLIYWYTALVVTNLINLLWAVHVKQNDMNPRNVSFARRGTIFLVAMICLIWGSIGILFFSGEKEQQMTTLMFLSGALICFSITTVIDKTIGIICILCIVGPGVVYNLYLTIMNHLTLEKMDSLSMSFGMTFAIVGAFLMLVCYIGNKVFLKVSMLGYINALLSQKLENINDSLEQRIKQRTKELENMHSLTRATLESMQEGILAVSIQGDILTYNNKFLEQWGISEHFLLSETLDQIFQALAEKADKPDYFLKVITQKNTNKRKIIEFRLKSGVVLEYYTHSQCMHKKIIGTIHSFQDITEHNRIRMQASLQDRLATTGRLVANVAHEVNNPIAWILSNLQLIKHKFDAMLRNETPGNETCLSCVSKLEEVVTESIEGAIRIQEIIQMFNKFGRIDEEETSPVDIHNILNTALNIAMIQVKSPISVEKHYAPHQPVVIANTNKLHQVFLNLIANAVQSLPKDSQHARAITISTTKEKRMFRIDIQDTGTGISPELISRIFEPFFSTKNSDEGTGLGLSICQDILNAYKGKITVHSEVGKGSTFSVHLPFEKRQESPSSNDFRIKS